MFVRRSPAIVLSLALSAAALALAPWAQASDGGTVKDDDPCSAGSTNRLRVSLDDDGRLQVVGVVWSGDDDYWQWKFKHNGDVSASGAVKANDNDDASRSFRIVRTMVDLAGTDGITFRAENQNTGEVCRNYLDY